MVIRKRLEVSFLRMADDYDGYTGIYYIDASGEVVVSVADKKRETIHGKLANSRSISSPTRAGLAQLFNSMESIPLLLSSGNMEWFMPPREAHVEGPFIDEKGRLSVLVAYATLDYDNGEFGGIVIIRKSLSDFVDRLKSFRFLDENPVWLFNADGECLVKPDDETAELNQRFLEPMPSVDQASFTKNDDGLVAYRDLSIVSGKPILRVAFAVPSSTLMKDFEPATRFFLLVLTISVIAVFFIAYAVSRKFSRPIVELANAASDLANGDLSTRVNVKSTGEVRVLVDSFNKMTTNLQTANQDLNSKAEELKSALAKEKELNQLQRQFVSMASHEFRTPLAIIDSSAQHLRRKSGQSTPERTIERAERIREAVARMVQLIDATLAAAKLESGKVEISVADFDLSHLVRDVCERQQDIDKSHRVLVNLVDVPDRICADAGAIDQVLTNLLSNAVKYSPGCSNVEVSVRGDQQNVEISVRDYGLGIGAKDLPNMFERFFRAKTSAGIAGTGIGLNLAKNLVELHQGSISVESEEGEGTTFTVRLPVEGPHGKRPDAGKAA